MQYAVIQTSIGALTVASTDKGIASIRFGRDVPDGADPADAARFETVRQQLNEYFEGRRTSFELPLDVEGTPFQKAVWNELLRIPYGETRSYSDIAKAIGKPEAARAVGMANHDNPVAVVIPCHRVIGRNGALTGYAGGLHLKAQLLSLERPHPASGRPLPEGEGLQRTLFT
jgi:methylated-DNA-[protein]-cysteine S-methyltransferase